MRTVKEINVDIKKLKAELKLVQAFTLKDKLDKAELILNNKGLVWDGKFWVYDKKKDQQEDKPLPKPRQFVISSGKIFLVHESDSLKVRARQVTSVRPEGIMVAPQLVEMWAHGLRFVDEQYVRTLFA